MQFQKLFIILSLLLGTLPLVCADDQKTSKTRTVEASSAPTAAIPASRSGKGNKFAKRHKENLDRIKKGPVDLLFLGDSITDRWSSSTEVWNRAFGKWKPANFGVGGDRTQNVLWRITNGELDGISPEVIVLMIGTNNTHSDSPADIVTGIKTILRVISEKQPDAEVLLLGVFPREPRMKNGVLQTYPMDKIKLINQELPKLARAGEVRYLDISSRFLVDGKVPKEIMPDSVHLNNEGYKIWADAITPVLEEMMAD